MRRHARRSGLEPAKVGIEVNNRVVKGDELAELDRGSLSCHELAHPGHVLRALTGQEPGHVSAQV